MRILHGYYLFHFLLESSTSCICVARRAKISLGFHDSFPISFFIFPNAIRPTDKATKLNHALKSNSPVVCTVSMFVYRDKQEQHARNKQTNVSQSKTN